MPFEQFIKGKSHCGVGVLRAKKSALGSDGILFAKQDTHDVLAHVVVAASGRPGDCNVTVPYLARDGNAGDTVPLHSPKPMRVAPLRSQ
jgi:hypothetical protein